MAPSQPASLPTPRPRARPALATGLFAIAAAAACGSKGNAASTDKYVINFPTVEAAIATDQIKFQIFDVGGQDRVEACKTLVDQLQSHPKDLPRPVHEVGPVSVCDLLGAEDKPDPALVLPIGYGRQYAIVASGTHGNALYLVGCVWVQEAEKTVPAPIPLSAAKNQMPVEVKCKSLADHCSGAC